MSTLLDAEVAPTSYILFMRHVSHT